MRAVADTNVVVSALLWNGAPRQVLERARDGVLELFTSPALLLELEDVLQRGKLAERLRLAGLLPRELVAGYAALARVVVSADLSPVIAADPDDDQVLACALAAQAHIIVSGDGHLIELKEYEGIRILRPSELLLLLEQPDRLPSGDRP